MIFLGIYLLIGFIIFLILYFSGIVEENIGSEMGFIDNGEQCIIIGFLILFIMILWLPIILWGIWDFLIGIYYFGEGKR